MTEKQFQLIVLAFIRDWYSKAAVDLINVDSELFDSAIKDFSDKAQNLQFLINGGENTDEQDREDQG